MKKKQKIRDTLDFIKAGKDWAIEEGGYDKMLPTPLYLSEKGLAKAKKLDIMDKIILLDKPAEEDEEEWQVDFLPQEEARTVYNYVVYVDDNFHYMDENDPYEFGDYDNLEDAINACKSIVDDWLNSKYQPDMNAEILYNSYVSFGKEPFITKIKVTTETKDKKTFFSAWDYAKEKSKELTDKNVTN